MHVGLSVMFQALEEGRSDLDVYRDNVELALAAEPLGFESVWTAEHHFTDYVVSPNPMQFLTYVAAKTERVRLGSMVMVLPWHDPVRVAEEVAVVDNLSGGRVILGVGRGLGPIEFDGFRLEMGESRQRFTEYATAITEALESGLIAHSDGLYEQPPREIRPRPAFSFRGRVYASAISPESHRIMARLGYGLLIIAQKPWETTIAEVTEYRTIFEEVNGFPPPRPLLVNFTCISESSSEAEELHSEYGLAYSQSAVEHYDFTNERLATVNGYEYYARLRERIQRHGLRQFAQFLADLQIFGDPGEVTERTIDRMRALDAAGVINVFGFGGMPIALARKSMELYAREVLPVLASTDAHRHLVVV